MITLLIIGGSVGGTVILSYLSDPSGTVYHVGNALTIRGLAWIATKATKGINKDASEIINFTGWSIAGISVVRIIFNARNSVGYVAKLLDWLTFWN